MFPNHPHGVQLWRGYEPNSKTVCSRIVVVALSAMSSSQSLHGAICNAKFSVSHIKTLRPIKICCGLRVDTTKNNFALGARCPFSSVCCKPTNFGS